MSYRDRDRRPRERDDYRGGDRYRGYGGGRDGYGGGRDGYGGGGGGRRDDRDRRGGDGGRRFGGGGGGGGGDRRGWGGGGGGGDRRSGGFGRGGGGGGGGGRRDGKRMGGPRNGPPAKRLNTAKDKGNWNDEDRHGLMQSLFMDHRPENFEQDWVFIVCPPGKRRLLVAANESTESYNNANAQDLEFKSCLPSGSEFKGELDKISDITILDTVYNGEKKVFYIVDMLHWKHYPYYDTEAEFRFFCLKDKWSQLTTPDQTNENNEHGLHLLEKHECTDAKILEAVKAFEGKIEGLLFIKKNSLYKFRESVDCLWLKLDKMEKVLGLETPEGIDFAASNTKDEKRLQEQEMRKKQYEERVAARAKKEKEAKDEEKEEKEEGGEVGAPGDGGDENVTGDDNGQEVEQEDQEMKEDYEDGN